MNNETTKSNKKSTITTKDIYPTSVNNQQCIGPCYYSNTRIIHPITLNEIDGVKHNFCPVNTFVYTDPITKKNTLSSIDQCYIPTTREITMDEFLRENVISPRFHFSSDYFVKVYYKINNLEELLKWLDTHTNDPYKTRERVFNNGMVAYGDQINIIDHRIVYFVNDIMINKLHKLYKELNPYITIKGDIITLIDPVIQSEINYTKSHDKHNDRHIEKQIEKQNINQNEIDTDDTHKKSIIIKNYIKDKFLGIDNIQQFMSKFIRYYKEEITSKHLSNVLTNHMIDYIIKRIKLTLEQQ